MALLDIFKRKPNTEKKEERKETKLAKDKSAAVEKKEALVLKAEKPAKKESQIIAKTSKVLPKKQKKKVVPVKNQENQERKNKDLLSDRAYRILVSPHISEKGTELSEKNKYLFKVKPGANKIEIKKAVRDVYKVEVINVKIINVHRKKRRLGRRVGWRKGYKKAIVEVKKGQKIELLSR